MSDNDILARSPYAKIWAKLNRTVQRTKDKYRGKSYFPIGTRKPIFTYEEGKDVPESEIKFFKLDTTAYNNATSLCFVGQSGTQKTTLIKTISYYSSLIGNTKLGVMDLKGASRDWEKTNYPHDNPGTLYKEPATLNIIAGCPTFALEGMPQNQRKKIREMNLPPREFADINVLSGLGFSPIGKQHLYKMLSKDIRPEVILKVVEKLYGQKKLVKSTYENISLLLGNMISQGFLTEKNYFDINQIWNSNKAWGLGFNNKKTEFLSVYVDKLLNMIFDRANSRGQNERYWIVVDDCQKAFGEDPSKFPSVNTGISALTQWRSIGINIVIGIQSPTLIDKELYSDIKHFFIYRTGNVNHLSNYIPNREIIDNIRTLSFQPEKFVSECIHVFPDRYRYERFFPFNAPIAN